MIRSLHLLIAASLLVVSGAAAQDAPRRPRLEAPADTNDWTSYFRCAGRATEQKEFDAFAGGYPVPPLPGQTLPPSPRRQRAQSAHAQAATATVGAAPLDQTQTGQTQTDGEEENRG